MNIKDLNKYLTQHEQTDQQFYNYLTNVRNTLFGSRFQGIEQTNANRLAQYSLQDQTGRHLGKFQSQEDTLNRTQNKVMEEVMRLMMEISELENNLKKQNKQLQQVTQTVNNISSKDSFLQSVRQENKLLFKDEEIQSVRKQTQGLRVQLSQIDKLQPNIDQLLEQQRIKQQQLILDINNLEDDLKLFESNIAIRNQLKSQLQEMQQAQQVQHKRQQDQIFECIRKRKQMEQYLKTEAQQKQKFGTFLSSFRQNFIKIKQNNTRLKLWVKNNKRKQESQ